MEIRDMEAFVAVTALGSVTAAAEQLHLTQPAISRRIQRIEKELDCQLFERIGIKLVLTPAGSIFYQRCTTLLSGLQDGIREVKMAGSVPPHFSIGIDGTLAGIHFSQNFKMFCGSHPMVEVQLRTARSDEIGELVSNGQLDLGIRFFKDPKAKLVRQKEVYFESFAVIAARPSKHVTVPCRMDQLSGVNWITYEREAASAPTTSMLNSLLQLHHIDHGNRMKVDSLTAQKRLVEADIGLALVPRSGIEEELRAGTLQVLDVPGFQANAPIYAIHRVSSPVQPLIEQFIHTCFGA